MASRYGFSVRACVRTAKVIMASLPPPPRLHFTDFCEHFICLRFVDFYEYFLYILYFLYSLYFFFIYLFVLFSQTSLSILFSFLHTSLSILLTQSLLSILVYLALLCVFLFVAVFFHRLPRIIFRKHAALATSQHVVVSVTNIAACIWTKYL